MSAFGGRADNGSTTTAHLSLAHSGLLEFFRARHGSEKSSGGKHRGKQFGGKTKTPARGGGLVAVAAGAFAAIGRGSVS